MLKRTLLILFIVQLGLSAEYKYKEHVKPLIDKYCISCHGPETQKAKLRMDKLNPDLINGNDNEMWQEVLDLINISEMPTEKAKAQPTRQERQIMVDWLTGELRKAMVANRSTGGKNVMRRMIAYEYNNTLRDLLDLDLEFAADLPPEASAREGFKNNNTVLTTSALHLEYFENIARGALSKVIDIPDKQPEKMMFLIEPENLKAGSSASKKEKSKKGKKSEEKPSAEADKSIAEGKDISGSVKPVKLQGLKSVNVQVSSAEVLKGKGIILAGDVKGKSDSNSKKKKSKGGSQPMMDIVLAYAPTENPITIKVKAAAIQGKGGTYPMLSFALGSFRGGGQVDSKEGDVIEVTASMSAPKYYEFNIRPENFPFIPNKDGKAQHIFIKNNYSKGTSDLSPDELPKLFIDSIEVVFNDYKMWPPKQYQDILFNSPNKANEKIYVREVLTKFMRRAFRRQVTGSEVEKYAQLFEKIRPVESSFKSALISTLSAVMCSSNFLYHIEPNSGDSKRKLNDYELANRLSYFLWSSMPDNTLFGLATKGQLTKPEVLHAQLKRMIQDPRSSQFVKNFAYQWLDLEGIRKIAVNPEYFNFDDNNKDLFEAETIHFVDYIFRNNLSITNFVDSDFAVLSPEMAKHYNIKGVSGGAFAAVKLPESARRGGVLTHASILLGNSAGGDTHPIKRGVWLLERILNDPPPPPPPEVPEIPEEEGSGTPTSLKEKLIQHAQTESCNDCHAKIDPWGVAFENYNALGQWREGSQDPNAIGKHKNVHSDPTTQLKNGRKIQNLDDLKNYILGEKREQFTKAVINKTLAYALGRYIEFSDQETINKILAAVKKDNLKFQTLVEQVVLSEPFLTK